jgi:hypothetical protein
VKWEVSESWVTWFLHCMPTSSLSNGALESIATDTKLTQKKDTSYTLTCFTRRCESTTLTCATPTIWMRKAFSSASQHAQNASLLRQYGLQKSAQQLLSGLQPKLTRIGAKLVETWRHVYISFGQDGYQRVAICLSTNIRPALSSTLVALQYLPL